MQVKQNLKILFFPKRQKGNDDGNPIIVRITIDGLRDEFSSSIRVHNQNWDNHHKLVKTTDPDHAAKNEQLTNIRVDLKRHFILIQATKGLALPEAVKKAYLSPINGKTINEQKCEYDKFQETLVILLVQYVKWCERCKKIRDQFATTPLHQEKKIEKESQTFNDRIIEMDKQAFKIYDDKSREKTLVMAIDEYLFNFLKQVHTKTRAYTTLEKWIGRRLRYIAYLLYRFDKTDLPLSALEFSFIGDMAAYNKLIHGVDENTAMNYAKHLKEVITRSVTKGWLPYNLFDPFACPYVADEATYLTMEQFIKLKNHEFSEPHFNEIRDCYVFGCYTGLSYAELYRLGPQHIITGHDGDLWIDMARLKTKKKESVKILPGALKLMEKFKSHPKCIRKGRIIPMPTNEHWNRCLKKMGKELGFNIKMDGHKTRYFFINVLAYDNDVEIDIIQKWAGHAKRSSTEHYTRSNKKKSSKEMDKLKDKLFDENGNLLAEQKETPAPAVPFNKNSPLKIVHIQK